ncbi:type IV pilus modification PilV family protein [Alloiococcus sp. CFN-8]|uniref:type IV pilus modification PilV family protein n=1 Tax=Alloiococcus sp. CFN-8 TaxID=3416081 RepID=UPI003CF1E213
MWMLKGINNKFQNKTTKIKKGLTLIEVLITLAIFAILAAAIAGMVMKSADINRKAEDKQKAMLIAQEIMEEIKAVSSEEIPLLANYNFKDFKIEKIDGKTDSFIITGNKEGFKVNGSIKPVEEYNYKVDEKDEFNFDLSVNVYEENNIGYMKLSSGDIIPIENNTISITSLNDVIEVSEKPFPQENKERSIRIDIEENVEGTYIIQAENKLQEALKLYIYKSGAENTQVSLENIGGLIKSYHNLFISNNQIDNSSRVYSLSIKVENEKGESYEISNYKSGIR